MFSNCSPNVSEDELQCYEEGLEQLPHENSSRRRGRPVSNAARERSRVKTLRTAFLNLQEILPAVPPDTKLSKLDVLVLATTYISHLMKTLDSYNTSHGIEHSTVPIYHPVKKWPMRTRLYDGILDSTKPVVKLKRKKTSNGFEHQNNNIMSKKLRP